MASIYINYPEPHLTVHQDAQCGFANRTGTSKRKRKAQTALEGIRLVRDIETKKIPFTSVGGKNGLWIAVNANEAVSLAKEIRKSLRSRYDVTPSFPITVCRCGR